MNQGVIFDMDGVLVDSAEVHYQAWHQLGIETGVAFDRPLFEQTFGMHNDQIIPLWLGEAARDRLEQLATRKEQLYREAAPGAVEGLEGAVDLVRALEVDGFKLAVGSSGPLLNVQLTLELLGLSDCFQALSTGDDVAQGKPHPEVFLRAAERLGLPPNRCVVVEDAPQGIEAGLRGGFPVIAVTSSRPARSLAGAKLVVHSLRELSVRDFRSLGGC